MTERLNAQTSRLDNVSVRYLALLKDRELSQSTIMTARAAILCFWELATGRRFKSALLDRFMRGVEEMTPPPFRTPGVWDPSVILRYYQTQPQNGDLTLRQLTYKTAILIALASAQRVQTLTKLDIEFLTATEQAFCFVLPSRLKQTKNGRSTPDIFLPRSADPKTCVWLCVKDYLARTQDKRWFTEFLLITVEPFTPASTTSVSRWIRRVMEQAGVDTRVYRTHSTRAAASSKARKFVPIEKVLAAADWKGAVTFHSHYHKIIESRDDFAAAVWNMNHE